MWGRYARAIGGERGMTCKDCIHNDVCRGVYLAIQDNTKLTLKEFQILCEKY